MPCRVEVCNNCGVWDCPGLFKKCIYPNGRPPQPEVVVVKEVIKEMKPKKAPKKKEASKSRTEDC